MENITIDAKKIVIHKRNKTFEGFTNEPKLKIITTSEQIVVMMIKQNIDKIFSFNSDNDDEIEKIVIEVEENNMKESRYKFTKYRDVFKWFEYLLQLSAPAEPTEQETDQEFAIEPTSVPLESVQETKPVEQQEKKQKDTFFE